MYIENCEVATIKTDSIITQTLRAECLRERVCVCDWVNVSACAPRYIGDCENYL